MKRSITGTLLALTISLGSGTFAPAAATEAETELGGETHTSPDSCPSGQSLYRIYCVTHQTHETYCA
jgi:hypothetical protein